MFISWLTKNAFVRIEVKSIFVSYCDKTLLEFGVSTTKFYFEVGQKGSEIKMNIKKHPTAPLIKLDSFFFDKTLMSNPLRSSFSQIFFKIGLKNRFLQKFRDIHSKKPVMEYFFQ